MSAPPVYRGPAWGIGARTWVKRCILCLLQPLTGSRATGFATVRATGADMVLPKGSYAVPIMPGAAAGQLDHQRLVKVAQDTTITQAGVQVPIYSALGGGIQNLEDGTALRWAPVIDGAEPTCAVSGTMSGGVTATAPGTLRRIALFDKIGLVRANFAGDTWRARVGDFPAGILAWVGGDRGQRVGTHARLRKLRFRLFVVTSRLDGAEERTEESDTILDYAEGLLEDHASVDGEIFSQPTINVGISGFVEAADGSYVHFLEFDTSTTIEQIDRRTFPDWLLTQETFRSDPDADYPSRDDALTTVDQTHNQ